METLDPPNAHRHPCAELQRFEADGAAGAVDILVEFPGAVFGGPERGDDKARIGALGQVFRLADDTLVPGQAEQVIDAVLLAPSHQLLAGEARVGAQQDVGARPALPDSREQPDQEPGGQRNRPRRARTD